MEPLSFDNPAETNVDRRFPTSPKVFVFASAGTQTRDFPHGNSPLKPLGHRGSNIPFGRKGKKKYDKILTLNGELCVCVCVCVLVDELLKKRNARERIR